LVLNIPTGEFELEPDATKLIGYETIVRALCGGSGFLDSGIS
jgi:hypothetical protein